MFNALIYFSLFSTHTFLCLPDFINRKYFRAQSTKYNVAEMCIVETIRHESTCRSREEEEIEQ